MHRFVSFLVAAIFAATLLAPIATLAQTNLVAGDSATVNNPDGSGAYLRSDVTTLDDSSIIMELPQGTPVTIVDNPIYTDTGAWVYVSVAGGLQGYIATNLLVKDEAATQSAQTAATEVGTEVPTEASGLPWLEPIDSGVVVDDNILLGAEGLPVRTTASNEGTIIGHAPVGSTLDVTNGREWVGDQNFVRVNFQGQGGYVNGTYLALASEAVPTEVVTEVPTEVATEVPTEVVTEVPTEVVTEVPTEVVTEVPTEVVTEVPTEVVTEVPTEVVTEVPTEVVTEVPTEVATEVPTEAVTEVPTEVVTEVPTDVSTEVVTEVATEVPTETIVPSTPAVTETVTETVIPSTPTATEPVTETVVPSTPAVSETTVPSTPAVTETVTGTVATSTPTTISTVAATSTSTPTATTTATAAPTQATQTATVVATQTSTPKTIASTGTQFDASRMIGSATVTGTQSGLICRSAPNAGAPVLMTLAEGTKVMVSAQPVNGYLGIDCGGLQGFADVNYLWSGGAGDGEITKSNVSLQVAGTGNGLNCRSGAGTNYAVITVLYDGTALVSRGAAKNGWTPVTCGGQAGWVSTTWVAVKASSSTSSTGTTTPSSGTTSGSATVNTGGDGLYCRSGAGTSYSIITVLSHGQTVTVRGAAQGGWVPVTCSGSAGWVSSSYVSVKAGTTTPTSPTTPGAAVGTITVANTGGSGLNCRGGAGTSFNVITTLALGQSVQTRSGSVSGWTAVICGGQNGFVSTQYTTGGGSSTTTPTTLTPAPSAPSGMVSGDRAQVTDALNLRYSASLSSSVAYVVPAGTVVKITGSQTNGFYPVDYDGLKGFMSADYLVKTTAAASTRGGSGQSTTTPTPAPGNTSGASSSLVSYAMRYLGYPYVWATHGPSSFDCSGFTYWVVFNVTGKNIGYGTWTQVAAGTPVSRANLQPGDLVFFQNTYTAGLSHVGMYVGNDQFIHAQNESTGVVISSLSSTYYAPRWYGAVRI